MENLLSVEKIEVVSEKAVVVTLTQESNIKEIGLRKMDIKLF
jgi:hypothetical protein